MSGVDVRTVTISLCSRCPRRSEFISNLAARYARARGRWAAAGRRATRAFTFVVEAERQFVTSLAWRRCRPLCLISPLVTGTDSEPVDPSTYVTFFRPWTQALECTRRGHGLLRERHVVGPRVPAAQWRGPAIAARCGPLRGYSGPLRGLTSRASSKEHRHESASSWKTPLQRVSTSAPCWCAAI